MPLRMFLKDGRASDEITANVFESDRDDAFSGIRCPLCAWRPSASSLWCCDCVGIPSRSSRDSAWCGTHLRAGDAARGAATSGGGRHVFDVTSRRYTMIGTKKEAGAPKCRRWLF